MPSYHQTAVEVELKGERLEESGEAMAQALRALTREKGVESILVRMPHRILEYRDDVKLLKALARIAERKPPCLSADPWGDPVGAYLKARRLLWELRSRGEECPGLEEVVSSYRALFAPWEDRLAGREVGDRSIYYLILSPYVRLPYSGVKVKANPPLAPLLEEYTLPEGSKVSIYEDLYHIIPEEFQRPYEREVEELRERVPIEALSNRELVEEMASSNRKVVARNVAGLGPVEALFLDRSIEDVYVNGPEERVVVKHSRYGELPTNLYVGRDELERWASLLRLITGRPFDELSPVMDGSLPIPGRVRFSAVREPLAESVAFSFRRHREEGFTLPMLVRHGLLSPREAALLWAVVHGGRSLLIAGSRGAGKTTLLSALLLELLPQHRIVIIEDTPELPVSLLKGLGYNVLSLLTRQPIGEGHGLSPEEVLRASLRLGDSALVVGEVRGREARVLYEAMRVGALSNFVGGTIHAESPEGVFDRVVNDLGVKESSFKATDAIAILSLERDMAHKGLRRRLKDLHYLPKDWSSAPTFQPLEGSPLLEEVAEAHGLSSGEFQEVLKAREDYYRFLALKAITSPRQVLEANRAFLKAVEESGRLEAEALSALFRQLFKA